MKRREFLRISTAAVPAASALGAASASAAQNTRGESGQGGPAERFTSLSRDLQESLNGDWHFKEDPNEVGEQEGWHRPGSVRGRVTRVPLPWQLAFDDLRGYSGTAWYERSFHLSDDYRGKRIALAFEAVDHAAKVWVNGKAAGGHEGGQTPFLLTATELFNPGAENTVTVKVTDPSEGLSFFMDTHSLLNISGIWRNVWVEATGEIHVSDIFVVPDIDEAVAQASIQITGPPLSGETNLKLRLVVRAPDGERLSHEELLRLARTDSHFSIRREIALKLPKALLWELDDPKLYEIHASLLSSRGAALDSASVEFGMRKLEAVGDRIYLNNRPLYIVGGGLDPGPYGGAVDVNWHLPPPYALPTDEEIQRDIRTTKSLGVNFVRVPLRSADPRFLYWADRMGLLVMQGGPWTPTEGIAGKKGFERYKEWWSEAVLRDRNHPSVALWELFNESFGMSWEQFKSISGQLYDHVKALDPTRFVLDNAGGRFLNEVNYIGNHGKTDIEDVHSYPSFPTALEGRNAEMRYPGGARELWLGVRSHRRPVLVTEFAPSPYVYNVEKIKQKWGGKAPWWFHARAKRVAMPAQWDHVGFEERFHRWGFEEIYGDFTKFTEASDWYHFQGLKHQTELMRMNPEVAGFVAWLFDSAPHPVGSIDFYKDKKIYCDELAKIWTQDLVIIDNPRHNFWVGETLRADLHVSHFGQANLERGRVEWWVEGFDIGGKIDVSMAPGEVRRAGEVSFRAPDVTRGRSLRLHARLLSGSEVLSENYVRMRIFPLKDRLQRVKRVNFVGFDQSRFQVLGYDVPAAARRPSRTGMRFDPTVPIAVTSHLDDEDLVRYLKDGATVILMICEEPNYWERRPVPKFPPIEKLLQANGLALGGRFQGGHTDSFFIRKSKDGLFSRIPFENPIHWPFYKVWPNNSIIGLDPEDRSDMLAGAHGNLIRSIPMDTSGEQRWSEVNATLAQFRCGKGRLIISTFELISPCLDDPIAAIMLNDLVWYAGTPFQPSREFVI